MHDCVVKLLKNHDEESLECLCRLLTTIGKDLDFEKAKVRGRPVLAYHFALLRTLVTGLWVYKLLFFIPSRPLCLSFFARVREQEGHRWRYMYVYATCVSPLRV